MEKDDKSMYVINIRTRQKGLVINFTAKYGTLFAKYDQKKATISTVVNHFSLLRLGS